MEVSQVLGITIITLHTILFAIFLGFVIVSLNKESKKISGMLKTFIVFGSVQFVIVLFEALLHVIGSSVQLHIAVLLFTIPTFCAFCVFVRRNSKFLNRTLVGVQGFFITMFILIHIIYIMNYELMEAFEVLETVTVLFMLLSGYFTVMKLIIDFRKR